MPEQVAPYPHTIRLNPGATIGILGGGQLGKMLALSAACLGFRSHIYCHEKSAPALQVTPYHTMATLDDETSLVGFARACDVITCEFENIPLTTLRCLSRYKPVYPDIRAFEVAQDRLMEKKFLQGLGFEVAPFRSVQNLKELNQALDEIGYPALLKTRRCGYDGKGQYLLENPSQILTSWESIEQSDAVLEGLINYDKEISVLVGRGQDGRVLAYDIPENEHSQQILRRSFVPARLKSDAVLQAVEIGRHIAVQLNYIGLLAVELFVKETGLKTHLIVNEIAPRVHNSGHWTMDACLVSQFEQHIRAIAGWPLADTTRHSDAVMENLIGDEIKDWYDRASMPEAALYIYGKTQISPSRKMGHVTYLSRRHPC